MSAQTQNYIQRTRTSDRNFDNINLNLQNYNNNTFQQNYNDIMNDINRFNKHSRITSPNINDKIIQRNQNILNNNNMPNNNRKENSFKNQYNNYLSNHENNQNKDYNNNYNGNMDLNNYNNINFQNYNFFQYPEQNKQNELILKILIYIYYYEKDLSEKNIFINSYEDYYLINHIWLIEFKKFYSYNKLKEQLELTTKYDYRFIDIYIKEIINIIPETAKPNYKLLPENLKTNILSTQKGIIFPKKIMNIINELDRDLKITKPNRFIFKDNNIYYINNKAIIIGIYQKNALFEPIYIFDYDSNEIESKEEKNLIHSQINNYILSKNCKIQPGKQVLKNGEDRIGILTILNLQRQQKERNNTQPSIHQEKALDMRSNKNKLNKERNNNILEFQNKTEQSKLNKSNNNFINNTNQEKINGNKIDENNNKKDKTTNVTNEPTNNLDERKELLKAFIYIYYYEKALEEKNIIP